jgi:chitodextrinase
LVSGRTYTVTIRARDAAGNISPISSAISVTTPDTVVPTAPTNLGSSNITTSGFRVSWTAATDNVAVTAYNVYRNGTYIATTGGTFFNFTGLAANTTYNITVLALDAAKNRSPLSAALSVKTLSN